MIKHKHLHEDECGCGCEHHEHHEHNHSHDDECGCGCEHHEHEHHEPHEHNHSHDDECDCGCEHHEHEHHEHGHNTHHITGNMPDDHCEKQVYILENLGCANCAAKMEKKIRDLPGVEYASITFATKQLRLSADNHKKLLPLIQDICSSIESEVKVVPRLKSPGTQKTKTYMIENLDCAHCASKMETRINELPSVSGATITFATKQLRLTAPNPDALIPQILDICNKIESCITLTEKKEVKTPADNTRIAAKKGKLSKEKLPLITIIIGAVLFVGFEVFHEAAGIEEFPIPLIIACVVAYLILGGQIVWTAIKNLFKGQIFDENFLMSVATIGAFAIGSYLEAIGVMLFYRIGEYFEHVAVQKSRNQIMEAVDLRPEVVNLLMGDEVRVIPAEDAQVGDILLVRVGDRIPLDSIVIEGESRIDTSPVTGEPVPVKAGYGDEVVSGCVNTSGVIKIRVEKVLEESMVTKILDSVENAAASKPQIDKFITRFARVYTPFVVFLALATAILPPILSGQAADGSIWYKWVYTALTFLVMSCPCALVLSVPLAFFSGIGAGSKKGILFKGGAALEVLSNISAVVMDKTGTITKGNFELQETIPANGTDTKTLLYLAASAELNSTHPIGNSIVAAAKAEDIEPKHPDKVNEIAGKGIEAAISEGVVLCGNQKLMNAFSVDLSGYEKKGFGAEVLVALNGVYIGHLVIADTIKEEAPDAIRRIKSYGITTAMLTGDAEDSANAVAQSTGVEEVHAKLLPQDKLNELIKIRNNHGSVMFVGDGINDAPVLAGADVGAAMGSGADAAIEAADVVFMNSNMDAIPEAVRIAKSTNAISRQNVWVALIIKAIVMILGLTGIYSNMWLAVFADTGVAVLCILNSIRILYSKK